MADFNAAFDEYYLGYRGYKYIDSKNETFTHVERDKYPNWKGWLIIDECKELSPSTYIFRIPKNKKLISIAKKSCKEKYWDVFNLDKLSSHPTAYRIFCHILSHGYKDTVRMIQNTYGIKPNGVWSRELEAKLICPQYVEIV